MIKLFLPGWIGGMLLTLTIGPLGSLMVWKKMSSFGDTISHAALLGFALGFLFNANPFYSIIIITLILSLIILLLEDNSLYLSLDTILGIIAHTSLSLGMILISLLSKSKNIDFNSYLFGDIFSVTLLHLLIIFIITIFVLLILLWKWRIILFITINPELAKVDGINLLYNRLLLMLIITLTISVSIKVFGALIITSLIIMPTAIVQRFCNSPDRVAVMSSLICMISITLGMFLSLLLNIPVSPTIVLCASFIFIISLFLK
ncbi:metal ABC transporter permease [Buchnera aphidicola (Neophyllaphis varicolor)]|uniref:metal ABC transporter permease n=1 Tax=Buchnera aphidicola TaxID=9 RepID=UPI0031B83752